jgi:predicted GNAT family acetyltransferase
MSEQTKVTVQDNPERSRYEALDESGVVAGFAEYRAEDRVRVFTHTEVDDAFEGQGVGSTLVGEALDHVRREGLRARVLCPFIKDYLERHPEQQDVVEG